MSSYAGLEAFLNGGIIALATAVPAVPLLWRATTRLRGGPRTSRALVIAGGSFLAMVVLVAAWATIALRPGLLRPALEGALMASGAGSAAIFLVLLLVLPRGPKTEPTP
jgi:hypothetical protein